MIRARSFAAVLAACAATVAAGGGAAAPGTPQARPRIVSPLQARVDAASDGARIEIGPGTYEGDLVIDRRVHLVGRGRPLLLGSGLGTVVAVRAAGVVIEGFDIDGKGGGDLGKDTAGIHVSAPGVTVRECRIRQTLFGVYLREAHDALVAGCVIRGVPGKAAGEKGSGIHVWNTHGFRLEHNEIYDVRDGFYIQSSNEGRVTGNVARDLRYGIHYMYSDDNVFEDNLFENGDAGSAIMYSERLTFRRNRFLHNRGFASVGLLFKECDDGIAEDNLIANNARGIFLEGSYRNVFRRNVVAASDTAIVLYDSAGGNRFEENAFVANLTPLLLVGRRTDTRFDGNYWSGNHEPDLDGDGRSDRPYRLSTVFDHFRGNLTAADLFAVGFAAAALGAAEQAFPVLEPVRVEDRAPLVRPPHLPDVPAPRPGRAGVDLTGLAGSASVLGFGLLVLGRGRRPHAAPPLPRRAP